MIETKTTSIINLIFDKQFKDWLKKGQPSNSKFSNLTETHLDEASDIIKILEKQKAHFSKEEMNKKYTSLMLRIRLKD